MTLEDTIGALKDKWLETTVKLSNNSAYRYSVDVVSGWLYYTPTYALQEAIAGKDLKTIAKTRLLGLGVQAVFLRLTGLCRNYYAKKWGVTKESPLMDKIKVNFVATTPIQAVAYAGLLAGGMALSGKWDWKSTLFAWGVGTVLGAFHSIPYGYVQDATRRFFGIRPAIAEKETTTPYSPF
jgi:hypothetical protein